MNPFENVLQPTSNADGTADLHETPHSSNVDQGQQNKQRNVMQRSLPRALTAANDGTFVNHIKTSRFVLRASSNN
jgi:hypothetical protein